MVSIRDTVRSGEHGSIRLFAHIVVTKPTQGGVALTWMVFIVGFDVENWFGGCEVIVNARPFPNRRVEVFMPGLEGIHVHPRGILQPLSGSSTIALWMISQQRIMP